MADDEDGETQAQADPLGDGRLVAVSAGLVTATTTYTSGETMADG